jgi:predicted DNA-binding transcriptional regulator AlpA
VQAAEYVGVSPTTFDRMIQDGLMPGPIPIYTRKVWDIRELDEAFAALKLDTGDSSDDPWGNMSL